MTRWSRKQLMRIRKIVIPPPFGFVFCGHTFDSRFVYGFPLKIAASTTNTFQREEKKGAKSAKSTNFPCVWQRIVANAFNPKHQWAIFAFLTE